MIGFLCEKCRGATAVRETISADRILTGKARPRYAVGLILCDKCRADAKAGLRSTTVKRRPVTHAHHRAMGGCR